MMFERFSRPTQRVLAVGFALLALLGALNLVLLPLARAVADARSEVEDARFRLSRLEALIARPAPHPADSIPAALFVRAPDRSTAADVVAARIAQSAAAYQVEIQSIGLVEPTAGREGIVDVALAARAPQEQLLAFVADLERGTPQVRWASWSLALEAAAAPAAAGQPVPLAIAGTASVVWEPAG